VRLKVVVSGHWMVRVRLRAVVSGGWTVRSEAEGRGVWTLDGSQ
jgi:hypothetical protein